jgi:hypothetical protein
MAKLFLNKTDILILTGISTASELAKEKGSIIHLSRTSRGWRDNSNAMLNARLYSGQGSRR